MSVASSSTQEERPRPLLFVNQHYWPDVASTGQHLTDLAEYLVERGHAVEMLASRGRYTAGAMAVPLRETRHGVAIRRARTTAFGRRTHLGRLADYASFYVQVLGTLLFERRYTGVIFLTTPPILCFLGAIARVLRGQRYGIWSMDLHPDAEIASGMLRPRGIVGRLLVWANDVGYRQADFVVDLGAYMKARIVAKGVAPERTHTVHVWNRAEEVQPTLPDENPVRAELGLDDRFVVMYSGNAGIVHEFDAMLEAMRRLRDDPRIFFLFVGGGPQRRRIEAFARTHELGNFEYRDYFPREQLRYSLSAADAHLISLRPEFAGISVPGKLYGIMASGRPALFVGAERCESADTIRNAECGVVVSSAEGTDSAAMQIVDTLRRWERDRAVGRALGSNGRRAFLAGFERRENCAEFARVIEGAWAAAGSAAPVADAGPNKAALAASR